MKTLLRGRLSTVHEMHTNPSRRAYMIVEAMVYIGVLFIVLGGGYLAAYRGIENSVTLRRYADDISNSLHAGERWRADVRASMAIRIEDAASGEVVRLEGGEHAISYRFSSNTLFRRVDAYGWSTVLTGVKASTMQPDRRQTTVAWRWELELQSRAKSPRTRPLFTFLAVPKQSSTK